MTDQPRLREDALRAVAERRKQAFDLYLAGVAFEDVADRLGYTSVAAARQDVRATLKTLTEHQYSDMEEARQVALARLDRLLSKASEVMDATHVKPFMAGDQGLVEYRDDGPVLAAAKAILGIEERRAKLLGIDAPTKIGVSATVRYEVVGVDPEVLT